MLIETLTGKTFTPVDACKWSLEHGYKAAHQGTYYSYFEPQFAAFGITCKQLSWTNTYHNPTSKIHDQMLEYLKQGYYVIALMKKGNWTSGGHFIVVWWADGKIRINDSASTKDARVNGDIATFRNEAAYYWIIDAREHNNGKGEEEVTLDDFKKLYSQMRTEWRDNDASDYSAEARQWAVENGLVAGNSTTEFNGMWEDTLTREQFVTVLYRFAKLMGKA
jgi:hypothetical protein